MIGNSFKALGREADDLVKNAAVYSLGKPEQIRTVVDKLQADLSESIVTGSARSDFLKITQDFKESLSYCPALDSFTPAILVTALSCLILSEDGSCTQTIDEAIPDLLSSLKELERDFRGLEQFCMGCKPKDIPVILQKLLQAAVVVLNYEKAYQFCTLSEANDNFYHAFYHGFNRTAQDVWLPIAMIREDDEVKYHIAGTSAFRFYNNYFNFLLSVAEDPMCNSVLETVIKLQLIGSPDFINRDPYVDESPIWSQSFDIQNEDIRVRRIDIQEASKAGYHINPIIFLTPQYCKDL